MNRGRSLNLQSQNAFSYHRLHKRGKHICNTHNALVSNFKHISLAAFNTYNKLKARVRRAKEVSNYLLFTLLPPPPPNLKAMLPNLEYHKSYQCPRWNNEDNC